MTADHGYRGFPRYTGPEQGWTAHASGLFGTPNACCSRAPITMEGPGESPNRPRSKSEPLINELDHVCENPPCVNPEHLDPVTKAEHVARTFRRLGKDDKQPSAAYMRTIGLTYIEIAEALGYSSRTGAADAVQAAIRKGLVDPNEVPRFEPLSDQDCNDIVDLRAMGVSVSDIAEWYGLSNGQASRISRGSRTGQEVA